ncbi:mPR-typeG-protein-coupled receptor [Apodospora peruviana]|uniref:MPR-typeG-protein-coupled receptor n=1 Tax=Apodospora peruviana TaxID=516989 RepID=A0AAE0I0V0_9PEZI|nr:mPR-typeG-protein-coupled receptor [Apodospora peruviana]
MESLPDDEKLVVQELRSSLLLYADTEKWQQSNEFLLSGYREPSGSVIGSVKSICQLHNETVNIYSHLIGGLVFALLPIYFRFVYDPSATDLLVVAIYTSGVAICFFLSALYHILDNHSHAVSAFFNQLDYIGIVVLMWGASVPTIYYGFLCDMRLRLVYWGVMTFAASCCAVVTFLPCFGTPRFRAYRAGVYASLGLTGLVFVIHGLVLLGWETQNRRMALTWMVGMALVNLAGAVVFATRIPERWVPYRFDIVGCSHQIFHVAVMIAACLHFVGVLSAFWGTRGGSCDAGQMAIN